MKTLVIFYSFEGNTRLIAHSIAAAVGADVLELRTKTELAPKGFMKYFVGGRAAFKKEKPELCPLDKDPGQYDVIFIGTPVWAFTFTPPLNTFFTENRLSNKKVALFCCHGGGKGKVFEKMKEALAGNEIVGELDFKEPLRSSKDASVQKAKEWAVNIANP